MPRTSSRRCSRAPTSASTSCATTPPCGPGSATLTRRLCVDQLRAGEPRAADRGADRPGRGRRRDRPSSTRRSRCGRRMRALPENCAEILDRFFARDESYKTIGEALDLPAGTIASRISRCLTKLEGKLEGRKPRFEPSGRSMNSIPEQRRRAVGGSARALPPAPEAWVKAAQELPRRAAGDGRDRRPGRGRPGVSGRP